MIKMGDLHLEWVLLHARNGEQFAGMVEVPVDLKDDDRFYKRCLAAELLQPKTHIDRGAVTTEKGQPDGHVLDEVDRIIELRSPSQVIIQAGGGKQVISCMGLDYGDKLIFIRAAEFLYAQFLDEKSPIVVEIRKANANLVGPGPVGEERSAGGLIIPGAGGAPRP